MPQKAKFTREEIVAASLKIVENEGVDKLTARLLGEKLGSSARPIFTVFESMKEVFDEVVLRAKAIYGEYVELGLKEEIAFKGVGKSYIKFASERPKLFQLLFMKDKEGSDKTNILQGIEEHYEAILNSIKKGYGLGDEDAKELYLHLWIYSHGIAVLIATNVCKFTKMQISEMLTDVFVSLIKKFKMEGK